MKLYWDANAFIRMVEDDDAVAQQLGRMIEQANGGRLAIVTSELTLAELLVDPLRQGDNELLDAYRDLFDPDGNVEVAAVDRNVLLATAEIRALHGATKLPDAIHLATAELSACSHFVSADRRLPPRPLLRRVPLDVDTLNALFEEQP